MPRLVNPITLKIQALVSSGATTHEKICVAADMKYPTYYNLFKRPSHVSRLTIQALFYAGIISDKDKQEYYAWLTEHKPRESRKRSVKHEATESR